MRQLKANVVVLPQRPSKKHKLCQSLKHGLVWSTDNTIFSSKDDIPAKMYFISDRRPRFDGDVIYVGGGKEQVGTYKYDSVNKTHDLVVGEQLFPYTGTEYMRIIFASTDSALSLPTISSAFLEVYRESDCNILRVALEYEFDYQGGVVHSDRKSGKLRWAHNGHIVNIVPDMKFVYPRTNRENCVIVHTAQEMFDSEEVYELIKEFSGTFFHQFTSEHVEWTKAKGLSY